MSPFIRRCSSFIILLIILQHCKKDQTTLFTRLSERETGIDFKNLLQEDDPKFSIMGYPYFYNGGGVAIGDINNDSLEDVIFTGNMVNNGLFLNKGGLEFEDVSARSGISSKGGWCTGVTMADVNEDGWLDIYICRSGYPTNAARTNLLFINNQDLTFTESASKYGLDQAGYSTQASFFDYDLDGDLDLFIINQSTPQFSKGFQDYIQGRSRAADSTYANKLLRNDSGHFTDVTMQSGINSNVFTFSLGLSTTDINQDGWPDIYITNDFEEPDYLYINNQHAGFAYSLGQKVDHTSLFGMGVDVADYNNDLLPDIVALDMLPEGNYAQKMHIASDNFNRYHYQFTNGMFFQYMKNTLQKNNGDGTFSEIGQLAGISSTDWSWSPLFADYDNDGLKDLFITNGYKRDNTDMQFMAYAMDQSTTAKKGGRTSSDVSEYISHMPGISLPNYIFKNDGRDHFENKIKDWGFDQNTISHGAAYADLDHDGDLDLITNNTDDFAGVYRNNSDKMTANNFLIIRLKGAPKNPNGIGSKIYAYAGHDQYYLEQSPVRGFQSTVGRDLHLGLGNHGEIDSLRIIWPDRTSQRIEHLTVNKAITLSIAHAVPFDGARAPEVPLLQETNVLDFKHHENQENDFTRQFLMPHFFSHNGPCMASGDINGDGRADIFIGGAKGQSGAIFLQGIDKKFVRSLAPILDADSASEDMDAAFFDADGDKDLDLYVVSGGYEFDSNSPQLQDRLYLNNGKGIFSKSKDLLPRNTDNKKCVRPVDFDNDGDIDLFVGGGVVQGNFPFAYPSKLFFNDGRGNFSAKKPANAALGMVNDALWVDLDHDGKKDLIVASEWMPLKAYLTHGPLFEDASARWFPFPSSGWWNCIAGGDFDKDGDVDLVVGNFGLNSPLKADQEHPLQLYYEDIDGNGSVDPLIMHYMQNENVPFAFRDDLIGQVPMLKKKFDSYTQYAKAGVNDIFTPEQLAKAPVLKTNLLATVYLENTGKAFVIKPLPYEAQFSSVYALAVTDVNKDGNLDLVMAGNNAYTRIYLARPDANHGMVMLGDGKGHFSYLPQPKSGINVRGDVRSLVVEGDEILFGVNNAAVRTYRIK